MSIKVEGRSTQYTASTAKLELAERMIGHADIHKIALESIFQGIIEGMEERFGMEFEASLKTRIWNSVSPELLQTLKKTMLDQFSKKILGGFKHTEIKQMLKEHKEIGVITNPKYKDILDKAYEANHQTIIDSVVQKTNSMTDELIPKIVRVILEENIRTPSLIQWACQTDFLPIQSPECLYLVPNTTAISF